MSHMTIILHDQARTLQNTVELGLIRTSIIDASANGATSGWRGGLKDVVADN
jgi:hypothetical protein